ncbi:hypothetical protein GA0115246_1157816 [Streptomyces sp. SolWspMP-sol7th]|nr:hypothetical protein GA0115246_1157816 [Streptomyces sp. SolWspMP-sol7th]
MHYKKERHLITECVAYQISDISWTKLNFSMHVAHNRLNRCKLADLQSIQSSNDSIVNVLKIDIHEGIVAVWA